MDFVNRFLPYATKLGNSALTGVVSHLNEKHYGKNQPESARKQSEVGVTDLLKLGLQMLMNRSDFKGIAEHGDRAMAQSQNVLNKVGALTTATGKDRVDVLKQIGQMALNTSLGQRFLGSEIGQQLSTAIKTPLGQIAKAGLEGALASSGLDKAYEKVGSEASRAGQMISHIQTTARKMVETPKAPEPIKKVVKTIKYNPTRPKFRR